MPAIRKILFLFLFFSISWFVVVPYGLRIPIQWIDDSTFRIFKSLENDPRVTAKDTKIYVCLSLYCLTKDYPNGFTLNTNAYYENAIFLCPKAIKSKYLKELIAHELGHLHGGDDHIAADRFAIELTGDEKSFKEALIEWRVPHDSDRAKTLSNK